MDIQQLKTATSNLSDVIEHIVRAFEEETQTIVTTIGLQRIDVTTVADKLPKSQLLFVDVKVEI